MEVVYYFDEELGYSPVKKYFEQYNTKKVRNIKILAEINEKIVHIERWGGKPSPTIAPSLSGYKFSEIKQRKDKNILIRILWFCSDNKKIVLLNVFEKPAHYDTEREKRKIKKYLDKTDEYYKKFILDLKCYEEYKM